MSNDKTYVTVPNTNPDIEVVMFWNFEGEDTITERFPIVAWRVCIDNRDEAIADRPLCPCLDPENYADDNWVLNYKNGDHYWNNKLRFDSLDEAIKYFKGQHARWLKQLEKEEAEGAS